MDLTVTQATLDDVGFIAAILTEAMKYKLEHKDTTWGSRTFSDEEVSGMVASGLTYIVRLEGEPAGTVRLQWKDERIWGQQPPNAGYMHLLAIKTGLHGQGLGKRIIDWTVAEVAKNNRQFLRIDCSPTNTSLCKYYEKQGFVRKGTRQIDNAAGSRYTAALYERRV